MKQLTINPNNRQYYSEDFIKGFNCGAQRQFEADISDADNPQGEWIFRREFVEDTPFTGYRCSNCNYWQGMGAWNFCPNCGAKMKGADDEKSVQRV